MKFLEKQIKLKDLSLCTLRSPEVDDANKMYEYFKAISEETNFMVRYPEEVSKTIDDYKKMIDENLNSDSNIMIGAFIDDELVGNIQIRCVTNHIKLRHRASFGIGIRKKYWNKGIGSVLLNEVIVQAKKMGYEQIELAVVSDNEKARLLYEKYDFEVWGKIKNAFKLKDGRYYDEITMGRILYEN